MLRRVRTVLWFAIAAFTVLLIVLAMNPAAGRKALSLAGGGIGGPFELQRTDGTKFSDRDLAGHEISASCLVGAIVTAGGGVDAVDTQPVQRALDLTWHTLRDARYHPTAWSPNPVVRLAHLRDLTGWNDHPRRSREEVLALLRATEHAATRLRAVAVPAGGSTGR